LIAGPLTVAASGTVVAGDGVTAGGALSVGGLSLAAGSVVKLVVGPAGAHASLARTAGSVAVPANQAFTLIDVGAEPGVYDNVLSGLSVNPQPAGWTIANPGYVGSFVYDGAGGVDLTLTTVPEPAAAGLAVAAGLGLLATRRRRQHVR
jgi:MYXO-CTERM domain-containing protein